MDRKNDFMQLSREDGAKILDFYENLGPFDSVEEKIIRTSCRPLIQLYLRCSRNIYREPGDCEHLRKECITCEEILANGLARHNIKFPKRTEDTHM